MNYSDKPQYSDTCSDPTFDVSKLEIPDGMKFAGFCTHKGQEYYSLLVLPELDAKAKAEHDAQPKSSA